MGKLLWLNERYVFKNPDGMFVYLLLILTFVNFQFSSWNYNFFFIFCNEEIKLACNKITLFFNESIALPKYDCLLYLDIFITIKLISPLNFEHV